MKNLIKCIACAAVLMGSLQIQASGKSCENLFKNLPSKEPGFEKSTWGKYIWAVRAVKQFSIDGILDPHSKFRLLDLEESPTDRDFSRQELRDLEILSTAMKVEFKDLQDAKITPQLMQKLIPKLVGNEIQAAAEYAHRRNQNYAINSAIVRMTELYNLKFLAHYVQAPFPAGSMKIQSGPDIFFLNPYVKSIHLLELVETINVPSEYFTSRSFFDFFNLAEHPRDGFFYKSVIPLFMPKELNTHTNWKNVFSLVTLLNKQHLKEDPPSIRDLADEINITSRKLINILDGQVKPEDVTLERIVIWVEKQIQESKKPPETTNQTEDKIPSRVTFRPAFTVTNEHGKEIPVTFIYGARNHHFDDIKSEGSNLAASRNTDSVSSAPAARPSKKISSDDIQIEAFENYGLNPKTPFGEYLLDQLETAKIISGYKRPSTILNKLNISVELWEDWIDKNRIPRADEERKLLADFLQAVENKTIHRKDQAVPKKRINPRQTINSHKPGKPVQINIEVFAKQRGLTVSENAIDLLENRKKAKFLRSIKNLAHLGLKIEALRIRAGYKTPEQAVVEADKKGYNISFRLWHQYELGQRTEAKPQIKEMFADILEVEKEVIEDYFASAEGVAPRKIKTGAGVRQPMAEFVMPKNHEEFKKLLPGHKLMYNRIANEDSINDLLQRAIDNNLRITDATLYNTENNRSVPINSFGVISFLYKVDLVLLIKYYNLNEKQAARAIAKEMPVAKAAAKAKKKRVAKPKNNKHYFQKPTTLEEFDALEGGYKLRARRLELDKKLEDLLLEAKSKNLYITMANLRKTESRLADPSLNTLNIIAPLYKVELQTLKEYFKFDETQAAKAAAKAARSARAAKAAKAKSTSKAAGNAKKNNEKTEPQALTGYSVIDLPKFQKILTAKFTNPINAFRHSVEIAEEKEFEPIARDTWYTIFKGKTPSVTPRVLTVLARTLDVAPEEIVIK